LERETGLEPATNSLEGCDSSQLSYSRTVANNFEKNKKIREPIKKIFFIPLYQIIAILKSVGGEGFEPPKA
jgi:hypothetical protein